MIPRPCLSITAAMLLAGSSFLLADSSTPADVNAALGLELFSDGNLWDDSAVSTASRIGWPMESQTSTGAGFRKYPGEDERIAGCRPYSCSLLAEGDTPSSLSLVFANKGDGIFSSIDASDKDSKRERLEQIRDLQKTIRADRNDLEAVLTKLFGEPVPDRYGQGAKTRETVKRWDWNGHAFLLATRNEDYVALRIMPVESADNGGKSRVPDSEIRARAANRVEQRPNGDVVLKDIPMVDQGPKGYCVPATWERAMRYMGVPADMYVLAMAAQTKEGGGTHLEDIAGGARDAIIRAGRRMQKVAAQPDPKSVSKFIDAGIPVMWSMSSTKEFNMAVNSRFHSRSILDSDAAEWKKNLIEARKAARELKKKPSDAHLCMIVGYNKQTNEIAVSDSWGPDYAERWITPEEAGAVCLGNFQIITF